MDTKDYTPFGIVTPTMRHEITYVLTLPGAKGPRYSASSAVQLRQWLLEWMTPEQKNASR